MFFFNLKQNILQKATLINNGFNQTQTLNLSEWHNEVRIYKSKLCVKPVKYYNSFTIAQK